MNQHRGKELCKRAHHFVKRSLSFSRWSRGLIFLWAALLSGVATVSAQSRHIELNDLAKIVSVSDPQISPDGKTIVVVVGRQNLEQDRTERELVQIDIASGAQHALTYERKTAGSPRWSPNGDRLAFTANDGTGRDAKPQIFVMLMSGGEARKISEAPNGIEQFAWRPDGRAIAYVTSYEPPNKKEIEKHNDAFEVGDNDYLATKAPQPSHTWLISADGGKAKRLTSGAWSLPKSAPPNSPASPISWSPDGKSLLFTRQEHPHQGDADLTTLQILNMDTGEYHRLIKHQKFESFGAFSPDGSHVAYWYPRNGDPNSENEIFVTQTSGGDGTDATRAIDHDLSLANCCFSQDSSGFSVLLRFFDAQSPSRGKHDGR